MQVLAALRGEGHDDLDLTEVEVRRQSVPDFRYAVMCIVSTIRIPLWHP